MAELDDTWNTFLTGLEDLGVDGLPADMEIDLRHVMNLESPSLRVFEPDIKRQLKYFRSKFHISIFRSQYFSKPR